MARIINQMYTLSNVAKMQNYEPRNLEKVTFCTEVADFCHPFPSLISLQTLLKFLHNFN